MTRDDMVLAEGANRAAALEIDGEPESPAMEIGAPLRTLGRDSDHRHEGLSAVDEHADVAEAIGPELAEHGVRMDSPFGEPRVFELVRKGSEHDVREVFAELTEDHDLAARAPPAAVVETFADDDDAVSARSTSRFHDELLERHQALECPG